MSLNSYPLSRDRLTRNDAVGTMFLNLASIASSGGEVEGMTFRLHISVTVKSSTQCMNLVGVLSCNELGWSGVSFKKLFPISAVLEEDPGNGFPGYTGYIGSPPVSISIALCMLFITVTHTEENICQLFFLVACSLYFITTVCQILIYIIL